MNIEEVISKTVEETVAQLKAAGLLREDTRSAAEKTEELLRCYGALRLSSSPSAQAVAKRVEDALEAIRGDPYAGVVTMFYVYGKTREEIADHYKASPTTISRNKKRLIERMKIVLFADEYL